MPQQKDNKIRVFLADDHPLIRLGIKSEILKYENIELAGEATTGLEAIERIITTKPDVILMDISMPDITGIEVIKSIKKVNPKAKIIALTMYDNKNYVLEVIRLGGMGYLMKDSDPEEIKEAIEKVHHGQQYFSQHIIEKINPQKFNLKRNKTNETLTNRELEIIRLIVKGYTNKETAKTLFISVRTVETHRIHIMNKLKIKSVAELTKFAIEEGIVT